MTTIFHSNKIGMLKQDYDRDWRVYRTLAATMGQVVAYYDKRTSTLVVDRSYRSKVNGVLLNEVTADRIYETHPTRESALRSAIAHADSFYASISVPEGDRHLPDQKVIDRIKED